MLEYVDAWRERAAANGDIIPSNIGLDGKIGGAAGGKWYGGVYGWGFTVTVPQTGEIAHRNRTQSGFSGFRTPSCSPATTAISTSGGSRSTRSTPSGG